MYNLYALTSYFFHQLAWRMVIFHSNPESWLWSRPKRPSRPPAAILNYYTVSRCRLTQCFMAAIVPAQSMAANKIESCRRESYIQYVSRFLLEAVVDLYIGRWSIHAIHWSTCQPTEKSIWMRAIFPFFSVWSSNEPTQLKCRSFWYILKMEEII